MRAVCIICDNNMVEIMKSVMKEIEYKVMQTVTTGDPENCNITAKKVSNDKFIELYKNNKFIVAFDMDNGSRYGVIRPNCIKGGCYTFDCLTVAEYIRKLYGKKQTKIIFIESSNEYVSQIDNYSADMCNKCADLVLHGNEQYTEIKEKLLELLEE